MLGNLLGSAMPRYRGMEAPRREGRGILGMITGLFGRGGAPAYAGAGQPMPRAGGSALFPGTPAYRQPTPEPEAPEGTEPPAEEPEAPEGTEPPAEEPEAPEGDGDSAEVAGKTVTIIVRPGPDTTVEEVVRFLQDRVLDQ